MEKDIEMVTVSTLVPIANTTQTSFNYNNSMEFGVRCYEAGMIHILKGIAEEFLETTDVYCSDFTRSMNKIVEKKRQELEMTLNPTDYGLVRKYEESINEANTAETADYYMQGFLDGYRYLSNRNAFKSEGFFKRENTCEETD